MKLTIDRAPLLAALQRVVGVVDRGATIPAIRNILASADGDRLTLRATNLDMEATTSVEAAIDEPGAVAIQALTLLDIVRNLSDGADVVIATASDDPRVRVQSGRSRFLVPATEADHFPSMREPVGEPVVLAGERLASMLDATAWAQSNEATRAYLCGVYAHVLDGRLVMVATQGHVLGLATGVETQVETPGAIVPSAFVAQAARLAAEAGGDAELTLTASQVRLRLGSTVLLGKVMDGAYPEYPRVIPTTNPHRLMVGREAMTAAVRRALIMGTNKGRSIKIDLKADAISVMARSEDSGEALDEISAEYDGPEMRLGLNGDYVIEALAHLTGETVEVEVGKASAAWVLRSADDADRLAVISPQRA